MKKLTNNRYIVLATFVIVAILTGLPRHRQRRLPAAAMPTTAEAQKEAP